MKLGVQFVWGQPGDALNYHCSLAVLERKVQEARWDRYLEGQSLMLNVVCLEGKEWADVWRKGESIIVIEGHVSKDYI